VLSEYETALILDNVSVYAFFLNIFTFK